MAIGRGNSMVRSLLPVTAVIVALSSTAFAASPADPDWPCVQRKVPEISVGQVWSGPPVEPIGDSWRDDAVIAELARKLAARRTAMDEAKELIARFAAGAGADRERRLTALFAAMLAQINGERASIIAGIGRYAKRQQALARKIEQQGAELDGLPVDGGEEIAARREELQDIQAWDIRIFAEREKALIYVCEQPVLLEQRAFALAREILSRLR
jgi:hypothetical protein